MKTLKPNKDLFEALKCYNKLQLKLLSFKRVLMKCNLCLKRQNSDLRLRWKKSRKTRLQRILKETKSLVKKKLLGHKKKKLLF